MEDFVISVGNCEDNCPFLVKEEDIYCNLNWMYRSEHKDDFECLLTRKKVVVQPKDNFKDDPIGNLKCF